jgi:multiple sugar transport system ATP-binding protein
MAAIRFDKVRKNFGEVVVVRELDLEIRDGEFFTFVGPSGCGKSTLLNMIAGLEPVTGGTIYFDGIPVNDLSPRQRDVAMVFQSYALYPHMRVYENIAFPLRMSKRHPEEIDREVRKTAALLGLQELLHRKPRELSGGQRQRVALGRAIIRRPRVFLMDEPLSNLDARLRIETRGELKKLHRDLGITTVYVTHDQAEAMSLSGRIAVLHGGEIHQSGTPLEVYSKPANVFVAGFIGNVPTNLVPVTLKNLEPLEIDFNGLILSPSLDKRPREPALMAGIRPEDTDVSRIKTEGAQDVEVLLTEPAGSFVWVDFRWKGVTMKGTARTDTDLKVGERAFMTFPLERVLIFDVRTGGRL